MKKIKNIITITLLIFTLTISTISFADVGSFDRYDSGGSSSWSSSSSSSWGSSSSWDWDSDYDSDSSIDIFFLITLLLGNPARKSNLYNYNYLLYNSNEKI